MTPPASHMLTQFIAAVVLIAATSSPTLACMHHMQPLSARDMIHPTKRDPVRPPGNPLATLRILSPAPGIYAYYDGRTGERFHSALPNWLDDGAFTLGVATYSIVSGDEALLFDAAITPDHAAAMLHHVQSLGVSKTTTVYSHFHNDHIAGASALATASNSTFLTHSLTADTIRHRTAALAADDPPITAVLPTQLYEDQVTVVLGGQRRVELHHFAVHTGDGTVAFLPEEGILFAGDTVEDTATFIAEPGQLGTHQQELERMAAQLAIRKILPAHGSPDVIGAGGYEPSFIDATLRYIRAVDEPVEQPAAWNQTLEQVVADDVAAGNLIYFAQYEVVHRSNVQAIQKVRRVGVEERINRKEKREDEEKRGGERMLRQILK